MIAGDRLTIPQITQRSHPIGAANDVGTLAVMTLNIAHGRANGRHQAFVRSKKIRTNLDDIAQLLYTQRPQVVALQEADAPSSWSGKFDHVDHVADKAKYPFATHGHHVNGFTLAYGTALLADRPLTEPLSITFKSSPPTMPKGFVVAQITWPDKSHRTVDIVSVHLDFARESVRKRQVKMMIETLSKRQRPVIIMGDFNCPRLTHNNSLGHLIDHLDLQAFEPQARDMITFPTTKKRLDWILISRDMKFEDYQVIETQVSDHYGVAAMISMD